MYLFLTQFFTFVKGKPPGASLSTTVFPPGAPQGREKAVLPTRPRAASTHSRSPARSRPRLSPVPPPKRPPFCPRVRAPALPPVVWGRRLVGGRVFPLFRELRVAGIAADFQQGDRRRLSRGSARIYPGCLPAIPQPASPTAPFTQGSLGRRLFFGQGRGGRLNSRRCLAEEQVFPHFLESYGLQVLQIFSSESDGSSRGGVQGYIQAACRQSLSQLRRQLPLHKGALGIPFSKSGGGGAANFAPLSKIACALSRAARPRVGAGGLSCPVALSP